MAVKFGLCTGIDKVNPVAEAGFDYVEPPTYGFTLAGNSDFTVMRKSIVDSGISCEACNFFYPPDFHVTGNNPDIKKIHSYIDKAMERAVALGVRNITIGSGPARNVPEGFPKEDAFRQFGDQIRYTGELAGKAGITITIEPIRPGSTNLINNLAEGAALADYVNLPNVKTMADISQMKGAGDTVDMIYSYVNYIGHLHTIDTKNNCYPLDPDDAEQIALIKAYLSVNPGGRISVEGVPFTTVENARQCLGALKNYAERV